MRTALIPIAIAAGLSGCCAIYPCHPGTSVLADVVDAQSGEPINGATVNLFGTKTSCAGNSFKLHLPSAWPNTITVSAPGYMTAESPAQFGTFRVQAKLSREGSAEQGSITWVSVSSAVYASASGCSPQQQATE